MDFENVIQRLGLQVPAKLRSLHTTVAIELTVQEYTCTMNRLHFEAGLQQLLCFQNDCQQLIIYLIKDRNA